MEWIILIGFAFFDYIGYNTLARWSVVVYRILQTLVQIAATWYAWIHLGPFAAVAWNFIWWAWLADLFYYAMYDLLKFFGYENAGYGETYAGLLDEKPGWCKRATDGYDLYADNLRPLSAFELEVLAGRVSWAWWTPLGLIRWIATGDRKKPLSAFEIFMQLFVMLAMYGIARAFV